MPVYAIGDIQGCYDALQALLAKFRFDPERDRLWFTGDLVNRGPRSADVVRFVRDLGDRAVCVLGNHDLHLLAIAAGHVQPKKRDSLTDILNAPDREALLGWLRRRPFLHHDQKLGHTLVHAGLVPQWDLAEAGRLAAEIETTLQGPAGNELLRHMYGDMPARWGEALQGWERARLIVNAFTRLRFCAADGEMHLQHKGAPGTQPSHLMPWFQVPGRRSRGLHIIFGHWSTLGVWNSDGVICIDSGCLWGHSLTAVRLDGREPEFFRVACAQQQVPHGK